MHRKLKENLMMAESDMGREYRNKILNQWENNRLKEEEKELIMFLIESGSEKVFDVTVEMIEDFYVKSPKYESSVKDNMKDKELWEAYKKLILDKDIETLQTLTQSRLKN